MLERLVRLFTSLRLTVVLLALGGILVFWGTIAQVELGLYKAQNEFFRGFFVYWHPNPTTRIPIFPGGYLVGGLLLINLFAAHLRYYKLGWKKLGIAMIHLGIVLLLLGQFATDMLSQESTMHLRNGETRNYSEAARTWELAIIEESTTNVVQKVVAIPDRMLSAGKTVTDPEMPFSINVKSYFINSELLETNALGFAKVDTTSGVGGELFWAELPRVTEMDSRDIPSGIVDISTTKGSLGTWLISGYLSHPQHLVYDGKRYDISLRPMRFYKPFSINLVKFTHDQYMGTDIPKNFSSRIRVIRPDTKEDREVLIYMNNPLRYAGETFYQASFDTDDKGTVLQVVHNPGWLTPYFACILVAAGLIYQFMSHLIKFIKRSSA